MQKSSTTKHIQDGTRTSGTLRVHSTSVGLDVARLVAGEDLVLDLHEGHGLDAAEHVGADDHLDVRARRRLDDEALTAMACWRERYDDELTVDGICLPFIAEWPLFAHVVRVLRRGAALAAAVQRLEPSRLQIAAGDPFARHLAEQVAAAAEIPVEVVSGVSAGAARGPERPPDPFVRRLRRQTLSAVVSHGAPTFLRRRAVLAVSYWPLVPLVDRLLDDPATRVAFPLEKRPEGPRRVLRGALQGGWIGRPGPRAIRRAAARAEPAVRRVAADRPPDLRAGSFALGPAVHGELVEELRRGAGAWLATAATLRRALGRGHVERVVCTYDTLPYPRLVVSIARESGVPTFLLAHGAYVMPQTLPDMELGDEVAIWSEAVAPPGLRRDRPVHVVGYPLERRLAPTRPAPDGRPPRVVVLGQNGHLFTSMFDDRVVLRHFDVALRALAKALPGARVVLRPHPTQDMASARVALRRFPELEVDLDPTTPIVDLLAGADLCIGALTAATLQAAIVATPTIALNVTGFEWVWPLGGDTPVAVARSEEDLRAAVERWAAGEPVPGRDALLRALGADRDDGVDRLFALTNPARSAAR
jgi:hypothetical protein